MRLALKNIDFFFASIKKKDKMGNSFQSYRDKQKRGANRLESLFKKTFLTQW
jgi:hypothetical protein